MIIVRDWSELQTADLRAWLERVSEKRASVETRMLGLTFPFCTMAPLFSGGGGAGAPPR